MIPFFQYTSIPLGPLHVQVWGTCVALGIIVGTWAASWYGEKRFSIQQAVIFDVAFWMTLSALIGARVWYVFFEWPGGFLRAGWNAFAVWNGGMSFSGSFIFGAAAFLLYVHLKKLSLSEMAATIAFGLPFGIALGRLGCFLIYDHPGSPTHFFLGEQYIDGVVRHNNGLYLALASILNALLFFFLARHKKNVSAYLFPSLFLIWYGVSRLFLDIFRATDLPNSDARWYSLTTAQYVGILLIVIGFGVWYAHRHEASKQKKKNN